MPSYRASINKVDDFSRGDEVLYVPIWANGDTGSPDCETGAVTNVNKENVFVLYYRDDGEISKQPRATDPHDLINMSEK